MITLTSVWYVENMYVETCTSIATHGTLIESSISKQGVVVQFVEISMIINQDTLSFRKKTLSKKTAIKKKIID